MHHSLLDYCSLHFTTFPGDAVYVPANNSVGKNEEVRDGSEVWMEADLRSEERSKRTLHWFVDGRQQKIFLSNLPAAIQFGVCIYLFP